MKISKVANTTARRVFRLCQSEGRLDEAKLLTAIRKISSEKPRDYRGILSALKRLVRLEMERRHVVVESATDLDTASRERVAAGLAAKYGADLTYEYRTNPDLLGGLKVRVGNDVFDGSVRGRLDRLSQTF
ncbi:MAG: F0F1 ATP synthase subunit delta [Verrucomicrobiota bacterium]